MNFVGERYRLTSLLLQLGRNQNLLQAGLTCC